MQVGDAVFELSIEGEEKRKTCKKIASVEWDSSDRKTTPFFWRLITKHYTTVPHAQ